MAESKDNNQRRRTKWQKKKNTQDKIISYGNSDILLDVCQEEYELEKSRTNTIDTKVTIVSAIVTGAIALVVDQSDFRDLLATNVANTKELVVLLLKLSTGFLALFAFVASLIVLLITIITKAYHFIDCKVFFEDRLIGDDADSYRLEIANKYSDCLDNNRKVNERRCRFYNTSVVILLIGVALFTLFLVFKTFM